MSARLNSSGGLGPWVSMLTFLLVLAAAGAYFAYMMCRINVPSRHVAILIAKTGKDLPNQEELAPAPGYKGVQLDVNPGLDGNQEFLTEGRYFYNPYLWQWEVQPHFEVPAGKLGVRVRLYGDDLPYGQFLAAEPTQKGILPAVLRPGRYPYNHYAETIELHDPVTIPAGYKGVVTNLAGPISDNPNVLMVEDGRRGVQQGALDPGTYFVNPYMTRITMVDCRSQRFNLSEEKGMGFPSKDGFWVSLDGIVEFRVKPEQAAAVFVAYNEEVNGETIDQELRDKVIMPNARSFCRLQGSNSLGREFIQGETRIGFQEKFQESMRAACDPLGIEIIQALITRINPPEKIAGPVRDREIAKQQEKQYLQEILQQESEKELAIEKALVTQKQELVRAEQEVVRITTEALQKQEVAVTKANEMLGVAGFKLEAARDEALAVLSRGKAAAEVVQFNNAAEAAGWKRAVEAFMGDGNSYARYVLLQKLAPAYQNIMANTADSPIMDIFKSFAPKTQEAK